MTKAHVIKLHPTKAQEIFFRKSCGVARFAFNWALNKWQEDYANGVKQSAYSLIKHLNSIKKTEFEWMQETGKTCSQYAIHNLESSFKNYFRKLKDGTIEKQKSAYIKKRKSKGLPIVDGKLQNIGKPNFKKRGISDSFVSVEKNNDFKQKDKKIWVPRLGWVNCCEDLRFEGKVNNVVIKRIADMWFAVINIEEKPVEMPMVSENQATIGIDMGIKAMLVLSDGTVYENPKALKSNMKSLKRMQRGLTRKVKGSNNRGKQQMKIARKYYRVTNIRKNAIHQATIAIVKKYDKIIVETLNVKGMMQNHNLAQAISDVSFGEVVRQLSYKAQWQGKEVVKADQWYASSKTCSCCGHKKEKLGLGERIYNCGNCGLSIDRDLNAAKNLAKYSPTAKFAESEVCGERTVARQSSSKKQKINKLSNKIVQKCTSS